jgi:hypothetical protein
MPPLLTRILSFMRQNVIAFVALFFAVGAGGGYAIAATSTKTIHGLECPRGRGHLIAWVCPTRLEGCGVHAKDASAVSRGVPS